MLYNNAGVVATARSTSSEEDWDFELDINLKGAFLTCKYAIPEMRKRGGGAIVNTASVQAFATQQTVAAYSASKGGVVSFTMTVALDHAHENIRCNCIAPGSIQTPMLETRPTPSAPTTRGRDHGMGADASARAGRHAGRGRQAGAVPRQRRCLVLTGGCYRVDGGLLSPLFNG